MSEETKSYFGFFGK